MTIDNDNTISRLRVQKLLLAIISGAIIITLITTNISGSKLFGLPKQTWATIIGVLYGLYFIYQLFLEPYYFFFSDKDDTFNIRYFPSTSFSSRKHNIVFPTFQFYKYDIIKSIINKKQKLVIYQKTVKGIFKYPPICLSALSKKEIEFLKVLLTRNMKKQDQN